jgi:ABC-type maltose transport system permease subunit
MAASRKGPRESTPDRSPGRGRWNPHPAARLQKVEQPVAHGPDAVLVGRDADQVDLLDAARIDGASELRIYWSVTLPVIRPILATIAIWTFLNTWNDFMWPLIVLSDEAKYTLPVALANLSGEHVQDTELMMAGAVVTVLPVMAVFLVLQRYYIQGVMAGSVKG